MNRRHGYPRPQLRRPRWYRRTFIAPPLGAVGVEGDRFTVNGRPYWLLMLLDDGQWADTGLTAPDDAALRRNVDPVKRMGFNGVRKHQKIEGPRFLYWADALGHG